MMTTFERRQTILRLLREQPGIKVTRLAELMEVSVGTIRNDLNALEADRRLKRVHGGAILLDSAAATGGVSGHIVNIEAKKRVARWAAELVKDGDVIALDASTTVHCMVPFIMEHRRLTVVTNGLETARALATNPSFTVILIGGVVNVSGQATMSNMGNGVLDNIHIQTAFVSGVGFSVDTGLTESSIEEASLKQAIISKARRVVVLVDANKIDKVGLAPLASLDRINNFLTDSNVSTGFINKMRQAQINLTVCGENTIRSYTEHVERPRYTIGFANQSEELSFAIDVRRGLEKAVQHMSNIDLVVADNKLDGKEALRIADYLIRRNVDLVIEYQIDEKMNNLIMNKFQQAGLPVIAVDIPIVGATYFGVDNYKAGHIAGKALAQWLVENWQGEADKFVVLEELRPGSVVAARMQGQLDGVAEVLGALPEERIVTLDSGNTSSVSEAQVRRLLLQTSHNQRFAIMSFNDDAAIGALRAARSVDRANDVAIVGQGADRVVRNEIRRPGSRIVGSTAYKPELYGRHLMEIALKILNGEPSPPAVYMEHVFITAENIDLHYPEDA